MLATGLLSAVACKSKQTAADETEVEPRRVSGASASAEPKAPRAAASLPELPAGLEYVDGAGVIQRVKATKAKGVVVNVWASWCGPCKAEVPMMLQLQKDLGPDSLEFVFVSVDDPSKADKALAFLKEHGIAGPGLVARPPLGPFKTALTPRWRGSLPASFLFDAAGKLRYWWGAQVFEHEITPILQGFLSGENIDGEANFQIRKGGGAPQ